MTGSFPKLMTEVSMLFLIAETTNARMNGQHVGTRFLVPDDTVISEDERLDAVTRVHVACKVGQFHAVGENWIGVTRPTGEMYEEEHTLVLVGVETADWSVSDLNASLFVLFKRLAMVSDAAADLLEMDGLVIPSHRLNVWRDALARLITIQMLIGGPARVEPPKPSLPTRAWRRVRRLFGR